MPGGTEGNVKSPSALEVALKVAPVAWLARLHVAAGMAAPVESTSVPFTELVVLCASARLASNRKLPNRRSMFFSFPSAQAHRLSAGFLAPLGGVHECHDL